MRTFLRHSVVSRLWFLPWAYHQFHVFGTADKIEYSFNY